MRLRAEEIPHNLYRKEENKHDSTTELIIRTRKNTRPKLSLVYRQPVETLDDELATATATAIASHLMSS